MKILVIIGWKDDELAKAYRGVVPMLLQQGLDKQGTPFAAHEICVVMTNEAINAYFEQVPDRLILFGTFAKTEEPSVFMSIQRMLTRDMGKRKFAYTNPIHVPPFNKEENFFVITDVEKMAAWLEI